MDAYETLVEALGLEETRNEAAGIHVAMHWDAATGCNLNAEQRTLLRIAFGCLLANSRDAMVGRHCRDLRIDAVERDGTLRVTLADTGHGIPLDAIRRVFDPFFTTKPGRTGLGLPMCRAALASLGGSVSIGSTSDSGTEMVIDLPVRQRRRHPQAAAAEARVPCHAIA